MAGSILGRIKQGLGLGDGSGKTPPKVGSHFGRLAKIKGSLPAEAARYVGDGDNPSVLLTLQGQPARESWRMRHQVWPRRDESGLFTNLSAWRVDQMRRFGEVCAALEPITYDWGFFGTKKSPEWLRHVVSVWLGQDCKGQPIETLAALAEDGGLGAEALCDILFCRDAATWGSNNSIDRFSGVSAWLKDQHEAVAPAFPGLNADVRAEMVSAIGRFGLHRDYLDLLIEAATGSSKKARGAARQALTGAKVDQLTAAIEQRYSSAAPGQRAELVEVVVTTLGSHGTELLGRLKQGESSAKVLAAFDRTAGAASPSTPMTTGPWARADGPSGYTAVDGSFVELPPPAPLPGPTALDPAALQLLEPAMEEFNRLLAAGKAAAANERWHWSRQHSPKSARDLDNLRKFAEGDYQSTPAHMQNLVGWLHFHQLKHPAILEFFCDPRVSIYHLVRFAVAMSNGFIQGLFGDWSGPVGAAVQRRLQQGEDVRTVLALWVQAGGRDHIKEHLSQRWYWPLPHIDALLWPELCGRFSQLDEALGMVPQSSSETLRPLPALELLAMFPQLPERYRGKLMLLANDSSSKLRERARTLLQKTPGLGGAIALQLEDGRQETRALAADWLAQRGDKDQIPAIRKQLKKERSDVARAAMITALERLGDDVSDFFDHAAMVKEAKAGLAKTKIKGLDWFPLAQLPAMHWANGKAVDPILPQWWVTLAAKLKDPGGNALMDLWLDRLAPGDAHKLGWVVLTSWIEQDTRSPTDEESNAYAAAHVDATLQQYISYAKRWPEYGSWPTDRDAVFAQLKRQMASTYLGSASDSKGILALTTRVEGADAAQRVRAFLKDHGSRVSQAKALLDVLAGIGSSAALQVVLAAANRSKQRTLQAHAGALVEQIAERNGWTPAQLADRTIPTGGLDADGTIELECGDNRVYRVQLDPQDALIILNAEGREVKALPGPRMDAEKPAIEASKKLLSTARKEVKQVLTAQTERLKEAMCLERRWPREDWENYIAAHPIVGRIATRLVWLGHNAEGNVAGTFRPLGDGSYSDAGDNDVDIAGFDEIGLAHSSRLPADTIAAWRTHIGDYAVASPFDQLGRDLPQMNDDMAKTVSITDREGWMIETFKLRGIAGKLGYVRGQAQDGGWFVTYERPYRDAGLVAEIEFTGSPLPEQNMQAALQSLSFRRLRDNGIVGGQVPLEDVPAVLLAESWQDLRDIADKGTGYDPEWSKKAGL